MRTDLLLDLPRLSLARELVINSVGLASLSAGLTLLIAQLFEFLLLGFDLIVGLLIELILQLLQSLADILRMLEQSRLAMLLKFS